MVNPVTLARNHLAGAREQGCRYVEPEPLAVLRLMTSSIFVTCCIGRPFALAALAPRQRKILPFQALLRALSPSRIGPQKPKM